MTIILIFKFVERINKRKQKFLVVYLLRLNLSFELPPNWDWHSFHIILAHWRAPRIHFNWLIDCTNHTNFMWNNSHNKWNGSQRIHIWCLRVNKRGMRRVTNCCFTSCHFSFHLIRKSSIWLNHSKVIFFFLSRFFFIVLFCFFF